MKYLITRTGHRPKENPNIQNAIKDKIKNIYGKEEDCFTIEVDSLEDLHKLIEEADNPIIIFSKSEWGYNLPEIEIYCGWRE